MHPQTHARYLASPFKYQNCLCTPCIYKHPYVIELNFSATIVTVPKINISRIKDIKCILNSFSRLVYDTFFIMSISEHKSISIKDELVTEKQFHSAHLKIILKGKIFKKVYLNHSSNYYKLQELFYW